MKNTTHLPDAMPEIEKPTLLVVCDSHQCRFIDVGRHILVMHGGVESKEHETTDRGGMTRSPAAMGKGGSLSSVEDPNLIEQNRLREFANQVCAETARVIQAQKIQEVYICAPGKFLAQLRKDMPASVKKLLKKELEGNFVKESPIAILERFRPDLLKEMKKLRDMENYSAKKRPPSK